MHCVEVPTGGGSVLPFGDSAFPTPATVATVNQRSQRCLFRHARETDAVDFTCPERCCFGAVGTTTSAVIPMESSSAKQRLHTPRPQPVSARIAVELHACATFVIYIQHQLINKVQS